MILEWSQKINSTQLKSDQAM